MRAHKRNQFNTIPHLLEYYSSEDDVYIRDSDWNFKTYQKCFEDFTTTLHRLEVMKGLNPSFFNRLRSMPSDVR